MPFLVPLDNFGNRRIVGDSAHMSSLNSWHFGLGVAEANCAYALRRRCQTPKGWWLQLVSSTNRFHMIPFDSIVFWFFVEVSLAVSFFQFSKSFLDLRELTDLLLLETEVQNSRVQAVARASGHFWIWYYMALLLLQFEILKHFNGFFGPRCSKILGRVDQLLQRLLTDLAALLILLFCEYSHHSPRVSHEFGSCQAILLSSGQASAGNVHQLNRVTFSPVARSFRSLLW